MNKAEWDYLHKVTELGHSINESTALAILKSSPSDLPEILAAASRVKKRFFGIRVDMCAIMNIKSGQCSENCAFCAQSAHYNTEIKRFRMRSVEEILAYYDNTTSYPVTHFSLVASGRSLDDKGIKKVCEAAHQRSLVKWCVSLGSLQERQLALLKQSGIKRLHHNLETARSYFPTICSTHSFEERLTTIRKAKRLGLEVCSGGILGMGESLEQRVELAMILANEKVASIPLNFLIPISGTPLASQPPMKPLDIIRSIAMFRLVNPEAEIRICAGREQLRDLQPLIFYAGTSGIMIGSLLTVAGQPIDKDLQILTDLQLDYEH